MNIPITKPYFDEKEAAAAAKVIKSGWVAQGPETKEFENKLAEYVCSKYAVAVSSGTTALHLALLASGIGNGDEVIVPSFSFIATANVVLYAGAKPVFVDIDPGTYNIDPRQIIKIITKNTKAIIAVHQVGLPAYLDEINNTAKENSIHVIEDAACALGSVYKNKKIGNSDNLVCFSFHPRKIITTGEGGAITSNNNKYEDLLRKLRNQGMSVSTHERHSANKITFEEYPVIGYNYRMTDIQAAVGSVQLSKIDEIINKRRALAKKYNNAFIENKHIEIPYVPENSETTYQSYILRIKDTSPVTRDGLMKKLLDKGISTRRGVQAIHREKAYVEMFGKISLPETEKAADRTITLPLYPQMTDEEHKYIIENVIHCFRI